MDESVVPSSKDAVRKRKANVLEDKKDYNFTRCVFANITLVNESGKKSAVQLLQNFDALSAHHRGNTLIKELGSKKPLIVDDTDESDYEMDRSFDRPIDHARASACFDLALGDLNSKGLPGLRLTIGKGKSREGADRGVDLLITCPKTYSYGVIGRHAALTFHPVTGWPMIEGLSDKHPVKFMVRDKAVCLNAGDWHGLFPGNNHFFLGDIECSLTWPELSKSHMDDFRQLRNLAFQTNGLDAPDERFPLLPMQPALRRLNNAYIHREAGKGGFGTVGIGISVPTGEEEAVKTVIVGSEGRRREIINESRISFRLSGLPGVIATHYIGVGDDDLFFPGQEKELDAKIRASKLPFSIHYHLEPLIRTFKSIDIKTIDFKVYLGLCRQIMEGLVTMRLKKCLHRDITVNNFMIKSENPPIAKIIDFGKSVEGLLASDNHTSPVHTRAPEMDGKQMYSTPADVFSTAYAWVRVSSPEVQKFPSHNWNGPQNSIWIRAVSKVLEKFGKQSKLHLQYSELVFSMLNLNPKARPTPEGILAWWPGTEVELLVAKTAKASEERPAKKSKTPTT